MDKAFDFKDLGKRYVSRLKQQAVGFSDDTLSWAAESALMSENGIVKAIGGIVIGVKKVVLDEVAKAVSGNQPAIAVADKPKP